MAQNVFIRKIPIFGLIRMLEELYDQGASFVDIAGIQTEDESVPDVFKLKIEPEYYDADIPEEDQKLEHLTGEEREEMEEHLNAYLESRQNKDDDVDDDDEGSLPDNLDELIA